MGHPRDADELFEIPCDELRSVVGDDPGFGFRVFLSRSLQNDFDLRFGHRFPQIPINDRTGIAIQNAARAVEGAASRKTCWSARPASSGSIVRGRSPFFPTSTR